MSGSMSALTEQQIHSMCSYLQGQCHKCPREIDTAYGRGEQGCHAIAAETLEKARQLLGTSGMDGRTLSEAQLTALDAGATLLEEAGHKHIYKDGRTYMRHGCRVMANILRALAKGVA